MMWTKARCKELAALGSLLSVVQEMNHGSNIIDRLRKAERLAKQLNNGSLATGRPSFRQFLHELAIAEREESKRQRPSK